MQIERKRQPVFSRLMRNRRELFWAFLVPASFLWAFCLKLRRKLYSGKANFRSQLPVICVGNIHSGGSAKTPVVAEITKKLGATRVAIVARGYGGSAMRTGAKVDLSLSGGWSRYGDEPWMLASTLGTSVYVGADRIQSIRKAEADGSAIIVMDDGFQHVRVARDVDLVCLNTDQDPSDLFCLPTGPLRESLSALKKASALIFTRGRNSERASLWAQIVSEVAPLVPVFTAQRNVVGLFGEEGEVKGDVGKAGGFCGIASPERFWFDLEAKLPGTSRLKAFADHQVYSHEVLAPMLARCGELKLKALITTEKDWPKVKGLLSASDPKLYQLRISYELSEEFWYFLDQSLEKACFASA